MHAIAITVTVAAAAIPAAALVVRAVARLPRVPTVELSIVGTLVAVAAITVTELRGQPLPSWAIALSILAWLALLLIFPTGRPTNALLSLVAGVAATIVVVAQAWPPVGAAAPAAFILAFAALCGGQIWRYVRRSSIAERQSTKWLVLGLLPAVGVFLGAGLISALPAADPAMLEQAWYLTASTAAMWLVPLAASVGVAVGDRGPIDELVRAGIAVTGTALAATATYVAVLGIADPAWAAAAACLIAVPAAALFRRVGTALAYSRGPQRPLAALPARLGTSTDPPQVAAAVARTVQDALGVPAVTIVVGGEVVAVRGDGRAPAERVDVDFAQTRVAELRIAPRPAEPTLTRRDRLILDRIAMVAGPAFARSPTTCRPRRSTADDWP